MCIVFSVKDPPENEDSSQGAYPSDAIDTVTVLDSNTVVLL